MTKSECYSQISTCNAGIEEDQKKISAMVQVYINLSN